MQQPLIESNIGSGLDTLQRAEYIDSDTFASNSDTPDIDSDTFASDSDTTFRPLPTQNVLLSKKQKDIVNFCSAPRTSREILDRAGIIYHTKNITRYITTLVKAGYLQMTTPENPRASNQKYRKAIRK